MLEIPYQPALNDPADNYSGRFIATGVILLVVAAMCGCILGLVPISLTMQAKMAANPAFTAPGHRPRSAISLHQLIAIFGMYGIFAVAAAWLGIGALLKRRWVRPLVMIFSTQGIIFGVVGMIGSIATVPIMLENMRRYSGGSTGMPGVLAVVGMFIAFGMFIGIPLTLLLLVKNDGVRRTAERYDAQQRWTDGLPMKVLGLIVTLVVLAVATLVVIIRPALPLFGTMLIGLPAVAVVLVYVGVLAWGVRETYRRTWLGWQIAFAGFVLPSIAALPSVIFMPLRPYYEAMGTQADLIDVMVEHEATLRIVWTVTLLLLTIASIIYLVGLRRFFGPAAVSE